MAWSAFYKYIHFVLSPIKYWEKLAVTQHRYSVGPLSTGFSKVKWVYHFCWTLESCNMAGDSSSYLLCIAGVKRV